MKKNPKIFILHISDNIKIIEKFTKGMKLEDFLSDEKTNYAVIRALEIIGEAVKNIPKDFKDEHKDIKWKDIAGTRDKLIHDYFGVNNKIAFRIVKDDIPELKEKIEKIINESKINRLDFYQK
jgi:uncharacterized protein with HEPN domain